MIDIWPAIDLLAGQPVRLFQGQYDQVTHYGRDLTVLADRLRAEGIDRVHLVDLSGAKDGVFSAWPALYALIEQEFRIEVGGGFRDFATIDRALEAGAERVVVGTQIVLDRPFAESLVRRFNPLDIVVGIDVRGGLAQVKGWLENGPKALELWGELVAMGYHWVNVTDIDRDGSLQGLRPAFWQSWAELPGNIGAGGGIATLEDLTALAAIGITRAVVGKAWLEGRIPLSLIAGGV